MKIDDFIRNETKKLGRFKIFWAKQQEHFGLDRAYPDDMKSEEWAEQYAVYKEIKQ